MPITPVIVTARPSLWGTVRAIGVCTWALWADYLQARRELAEFERAHLVPDTTPAAELDKLDESALESFAREFGRPGWLSLTALALVISVVGIDLVDGWQTVADALRTALAWFGSRGA